MSAGPIPQPARPSVHSCACWTANSSDDTPAALAWASSIHGRKSAGRSSGNVRQRLVRSPFGSMSSAGSPARRTSSMSTTPRPVLPDPVMPTITPCVVNESVPIRTSSPVRSCVAGSTLPPRNSSAIPARVVGRCRTRRQRPSHVCYDCRMTVVASRELRNNTRALLDRVNAGEVITISVDGREVAELRPVSRTRRWMPRSEFVRRIVPAQADAALRSELRDLSPDTTDDLR